MLNDDGMSIRLKNMQRRAIYLISVGIREDINSLISEYIGMLHMSNEAISEHGLTLINDYMDKYDFKPIELKKWNYEENYKLVNEFMVTLAEERNKRFKSNINNSVKVDTFLN